MKPTTLLIMAAGIGSRYKKSNSQSAIKQLEPVGMNDEIIMDFSIQVLREISVENRVNC